MGVISGLSAGMGSLLGGAASAGGSIIGSAMTASGQRDTNVENEIEAQKNRNFQAQMSNSAYQRATADMESAGLNPMLAFSQGGSSTPSGAQATASNPMSSNIISGALSSGLDAARGIASVKNVEADTKFKAATTAATATSALKTASQIPSEKTKAAVSEALLPAIKGISDRLQPVSSSAASLIDYIGKKSGDLGTWIGNKTNPDLASPVGGSNE